MGTRLILRSKKPNSSLLANKDLYLITSAVVSGIIRLNFAEDLNYPQSVFGKVLGRRKAFRLRVWRPLWRRWYEYRRRGL